MSVICDARLIYGRIYGDIYMLCSFKITFQRLEELVPMEKTAVLNYLKYKPTDAKHWK